MKQGELKMKTMAVFLTLTLMLPTASLAGDGRYQAVPVLGGAILIMDTRTGEFVKRCALNGKCKQL
jgi:hypothetical protein